jgi:hypothetical protein
VDETGPDAEQRWWHSPVVGWLVGALFGFWYLTAAALLGLAMAAWYLLDWPTVAIVLATAAAIIVLVNGILG